MPRLFIALPVPAEVAERLSFGERLAEEVVLFENELTSSGPRYLIGDRAPLHLAAPRTSGATAELPD